MHTADEARRQAVARGWASTALDQKTYAANHGVSTRTLREWVRRYGVTDRPAARALNIIDTAIAQLRVLRAAVAAEAACQCGGEAGTDEQVTEDRDEGHADSEAPPVKMARLIHAEAEPLHRAWLDDRAPEGESAVAVCRSSLDAAAACRSMPGAGDIDEPEHEHHAGLDDAAGMPDPVVSKVEGSTTSQKPLDPADDDAVTVQPYTVLDALVAQMEGAGRDAVGPAVPDNTAALRASPRRPRGSFFSDFG